MQNKRYSVIYHIDIIHRLLVVSIYSKHSYIKEYIQYKQHRRYGK